MPFKSEKQRRFLWAEHPEIAKRWARKYPESNKGLPMYAESPDSKEKAAALAVLGGALAKHAVTLTTNPASYESVINDDGTIKKSNDGLVRVELPKTEGPTYAGQEQEAGKETSCKKDLAPNSEKVLDLNNPVAAKLATVLSHALREKLERENALVEGRDPLHVPRNMGIKRYAVAPQLHQLPMGMQPQAPAPAQNQPSNGPVGGGNNPQANPIQAFGPLSASGQLNGNAAFGVKNSPDSSKTSAFNPLPALQKGVARYGELLTGSKIPQLAAKSRLSADHLGSLAGQSPWNMITSRARQALADVGVNAAQQTVHGAVDLAKEKALSRATQLGTGAAGLAGAGLLAHRAMNAKQAAESGAWTRAEGKNPDGGLNAKGRASLKAQGHDIKAPVTESNPSGERAQRQNSFCSRMCGMKKHETGAKTKSDPDSRINKSLRKWNCKCSSAYEFGALASRVALNDINEKSAARGDMFQKMINSGALNFVSGLSGRTPGRATAGMGTAGMSHAGNQAKIVADFMRRARGMVRPAQPAAAAALPVAAASQAASRVSPDLLAGLKQFGANIRKSNRGKYLEGVMDLPIMSPRVRELFHGAPPSAPFGALPSLAATLRGLQP